MEDHSSDESGEEEEIMDNFDEIAKSIVQTGTLPEKSAERYSLVYNTYKKWKEDNIKSLSESEENNLLVYFQTLTVKKVAPPTLWSVWSMLRKTLGTRDDIDLSRFLSLKSYIKKVNKGYKPRKAFVLRWNHIMKFMNEAPDSTELARKIMLIFAICGCLRCDEIKNMKIHDIEDLGDRLLVSVNDNKNDYSGQFIIGTMFYAKVKSYIALREKIKQLDTDRLFIRYKDGKCYSQPIGIHKIGETPCRIATYLGLPKPERYTGHSFRRSSATLLSDSGATMQMIEQLGRWRSDAIAQGYLEDSLLDRQLIHEGVIHQHTRSLANAQGLSNNDAHQLQINSSNVPSITSSTARIMDEEPSTSAQALLFDTQNFSDSHVVQSTDDALVPVLQSKESTDPETSIHVVHMSDITNNNNYELNWSDFSEDFNEDLQFTTDGDPKMDNSNVYTNLSKKPLPGIENCHPKSLMNQKPFPDKPIRVGFVTAGNKKINDTTMNSNTGSAANRFFNKPPVSLQFKSKSSDTTSLIRKRKAEGVVDHSPRGRVIPMKKQTSRFGDCTFKSCEFNVCNSKKNDNDIPNDGNNNFTLESEKNDCEFENCIFDHCVFNLCERTNES
ncbi:hypothetical protein QAD02_003689 [Eretmocerus hayati]|uniref:Uncharacterized protein n=1 Tax=Eretmocerus hayati TaxID=131215 RepID=A0ACC2NMG5_9HYME|nr:hypothetical protein QAD02_003689 [Eretmocerus hayati]